MFRWYSADLHIHSVLSPCAELDMGPINIVRSAEKLELDIIAITDHNAAANVGGVLELTKGGYPRVIPGMEVQTREEVHLLCYFPTLSKLLDFASFIRDKLPGIPNRPEVFGEQVIVNAAEEILGFEDTLLASSVDASVEEVASKVVAAGGLIIPAHIDRPAFSLLANLGFIPPKLPVAALEVARPEKRQGLLRDFPTLNAYNLVSFSDSHFLGQMERNCRTYFYLKEPTFSELTMALQGLEARKVVIGDRGKKPGNRTC
jgi:PHP family Zn ribbon phosphoesterase